MTRRFPGLIGEAQRLAEKHGKTAVVIVLVDDEAGTLQSVSYGTDARRCEQAKRMANHAFRAVNDALLNDLPDAVSGTGGLRAPRWPRRLRIV